jgi:ribosomal-protein-alanine N-acetyltransferase
MSAILKQPDRRFRPMKELDLKEVMGIEQRAYRYPWTDGIMRDCLRVGYCCWVFERDSMIEAYGVMSVAAGEAHILNLCVRPESQRQGLGTRMLNQLIEVARRHGADTLLLEVRPSNRPALSLYRKAGFHEVGERKHYYPADRGRENALILARSLNI